MTADPGIPPEDNGARHNPPQLRAIGAGLLKGARHIVTYFGLLVAAGAGLVIIGKALRLLGLSTNAAHIARFAMIGIYVAVAVSTARGKR